ncbi:MAG: LUD domain-containing protein [Candidatus Andersenbacteria bacterium]
MEINAQFGQLADQATVDATAAALTNNGITTLVVDSGAEAKAKVLELLPEGAEVMNMTSMTLEGISVVKEILESTRYASVRKKLNALDQEKDDREMRCLGAAPAWVVGSVHAVTRAGQILVASNTGSQLPAYAYGAQHVIWVIGTHKLVKNMEEGIKRLYEYSLPREDERARKVYGVGSGVSKILVVNKELAAGRITAILVQEKLGF